MGGFGRQYLDDARDEPLQALRISIDEQGDVYVSIGHPEHRIHRAEVRLCASGGAGEIAPDLLKAMREAYRAMGEGREALQ